MAELWEIAFALDCRRTALEAEARAKALATASSPARPAPPTWEERTKALEARAAASSKSRHPVLWLYVRGVLGCLYAAAGAVLLVQTALEHLF